MKLVIDVESWYKEHLLDYVSDNITAPKTYKDEDKIKEYIESKKQDVFKKMMVDTHLAKIKLIGVYDVTDSAQTKFFTPTLKELGKLLNENDVELIGYNIKKYDIPLLLNRAIEDRLDFPYYELKQACERYPKSTKLKVVDMMEVLNGYGEWKSLDLLGKIYLNTPKKEINFLTCTDEELLNHVREDCSITYELYKLFLPLTN